MKLIGFIFTGTAEKCRRVTNVPMDGNCMFSALALQLQHSQHSNDPASFIRAELVEHLRSHQDIVRAFRFVNCSRSLFMTLLLTV